MEMENLKGLKDDYKQIVSRNKTDLTTFCV